MGQENKWIVWLSQQGGQMLLGLPTTASPKTRFCILGTMTDEAAVGFWIEIDLIQEWSIRVKRAMKEFTVTPRKCLIRWDFVTHIQIGLAAENAGFVQQAKK